MTPAASGVCRPMLQHLDVAVRQGIERRVDSMIRELNYLAGVPESGVARLRSAGWSDDTLHVIFVLNSVFQRLLGPLRAAARGGPKGLGTDIPVTYGSMVFDAGTAKSITAAMESFNLVTRSLGVQPSWLRANTCRDLIFAMTGVAAQSDGSNEDLEG